MLERAKIVSKLRDGYNHIEYVRCADDLIVLIDGYRKQQWLEKEINIGLRQELLKINVELHEEKIKTVDLKNGKTFSFLVFNFRIVKTKQCKIGIQKMPKIRAKLLC